MIFAVFCMFALLANSSAEDVKVPEPKAAECSLAMTSATAGTLTSAGYPSYYPMSKCVTTINAPAGKTIQVTLLELDTFKQASTCNKISDRIRVYDRCSSYILKRTWCGTTLPDDATFTSTENVVRVVFKTHRLKSCYNNSYTGFNISVLFVEAITTASPNATTTTPTTTTTTTTATTTPGLNATTITPTTTTATATTTTVTTATTTTTSPTSSTTTTSGGETSCGKSKYADAGVTSNQKIIGGNSTSPYEFPWLAVLFKSANNKSYCGGAILNKRWILTAAHCIVQYVSSPSSLEVGIHIKNLDTEAGATILSVSQIIMHANYSNPTLYNNDIALMKVSQDITYSDEIQPVCMPEAGNLYVGRTSIIAGWGRTSDNEERSTFAQYASMTIPTNSDCNDMMTSKYPGALNVNSKMVCTTDGAGNTDRDTCQGDSGGPMTVKESDGTFHIVGITSWGYGCASGTPGVYTRVTRYLKWIQSRI